ARSSVSPTSDFFSSLAVSTLDLRTEPLFKAVCGHAGIIGCGMRNSTQPRCGEGFLDIDCPRAWWRFSSPIRGLGSRNGRLSRTLPPGGHSGRRFTVSSGSDHGRSSAAVWWYAQTEPPTPAGSSSSPPDRGRPKLFPIFVADDLLFLNGRW